jgi:hypothetical protein
MPVTAAATVPVTTNVIVAANNATRFDPFRVIFDRIF